MKQEDNKKIIFNRIVYILIDMGYTEIIKKEETNLKTDLGFDYLDLADFLNRIEKEFQINIDINILPNYSYYQFETVESTINFLLKANIT